jgi:hypothetical protein
LKIIGLERDNLVHDAGRQQEFRDIDTIPENTRRLERKAPAGMPLNAASIIGIMREWSNDSEAFGGIETVMFAIAQPRRRPHRLSG